MSERTGPVNPSAHADGPSRSGEDTHPDDVFGGDDISPYEKQRRVHRFLTQETRNHILQTILGHPEHLVSVTEFDHFVPKSRSTISEHLVALEEKNIIAKYLHEPNQEQRGLPAEFWGLTPLGVELLHEYKILRGVPIMRALTDHTYVTQQVKRHRDAPRPELPEAVAAALSYDEPDSSGILGESERVDTLRDSSLFATEDADDSESASEKDTGTDGFESLF